MNRTLQICIKHLANKSSVANYFSLRKNANVPRWKSSTAVYILPID